MTGVSYISLYLAQSVECTKLIKQYKAKSEKLILLILVLSIVLLAES